MLIPILFALQGLAAGETCPASGDVQARVRTILHLAPEQQLTESFLIERHEAGLYVVLKAADASVIGERTLPLEGSCDELAQAAAVVLSAWLTDVHPDFAAALPAPTTGPAAEPQTAPQSEQPAAPEPAPRKPAPVFPVRPSAPTNPGRFDWGLGAGADVASVGFAPAALASAGYGFEVSGLGISLFAAVSSSREQELGPGNVEWRRWPLTLAPRWRLTQWGLRWDVSAGPTVAWLHLVGKNFTDQATEDGAAFGGSLTIRAAGQGSWAPFGLANLQFYPGDSVAYITAGTGRQEFVLPSLTFLVTAGLRFSH